MRAILLKKGRKVNVYVLEVRGSIKVLDFLDDPGDKATEGYRNGFRYLIDLIADKRGYLLPAEQFKCWKEKRNEICEMIKGPFRIGCFRYPGGNLLLVTVFRKQKPKERKEYNRAFRLKQRFDQILDWSD